MKKPRGLIKTARPHKTQLVKVWVEVDLGIVRLVRELNLIRGVLTHASCQESGIHGYVMCSWTPEALKKLRRWYDVTLPKGGNGTWGYVYWSPEDQRQGGGER